MYLQVPPSSTLLHWLQFFLSLSFLDKTSFEAQLGRQHGVKNLDKLGNISPYHNGPQVPGVSVDLPADCTVDQVILLQRHGSRGPTGPPDQLIHELVDTLHQAHDIIQVADLPPSLQFLKQGYKYRLTPEQLTVVGRKEGFDNGVEFALRYPTFSTDVVVTTAVQRVIDTAHFWTQGFFGLEAENITLLTVDDFHEPVPWLNPWRSCPKMVQDGKKAAEWSTQYIPPIAKKLNQLIPGINISIGAIRGALHACAFDLAVDNRSPWCDVFTTDELRDFEYELDLDMDSYSGHASQGDPGPLIGAFYIKKLIERLTNESAHSLYLDFGHETSILMPLSTMGLNKDALPLSPTHPPAHRKFRTSDQTPFAANMIWEKFTCTKSFKGPQIRLLLNSATFPLTICEQSKHDAKYGTCSLDAFVRANEFSWNVEYHGDVWNVTCELEN